MKTKTKKEFSPRNDSGKVVILPDTLHHELKVEATKKKLTLTNYVISLLTLARKSPRPSA